MSAVQKVMLMILDGWGDGDGTRSDAIASTFTPQLDALRKQFAYSQLRTSGEDVGLPDGQMGNSEVGHLNIGAGRIVYQDLLRINRDIESGAIEQNTVLRELITYAKEHNKALHFLGLVSNGGVHSLDKHLYKLCDMTQAAGLPRVFIHAFTDGRDTDPKSGYGFLQNLQNHIQGTRAEIVSILGRYYAMDRDKRWERIKVAYDLLLEGKGEASQDLLASIQTSYTAGVTDEFIKPIVKVDATGKALGRIEAGDVVFCFNYRTDRLRELTIVLTQQDMPEAGMQTIPLKYGTMTRYEETFKNVAVAYDKENLQNTMGEVVSKAGCTQLRIAETEKYAHVTFFFSGGREEPYTGEHRILIPSPKVATYDLQPRMSALEVTDKLLTDVDTQSPDFICLNFANGDMVGHTGIYPAIQEAVRTVDACVGLIVSHLRDRGYELVIIADHGNADHAINADGSPNTAHSLNPVPIIVVSDRFKHVDAGRLADVAPTLLKMMGLPQPKEMTGSALCHE
ncbi:MAG: 2,3-bisphosphoglycerate-independent phosphoglycerate mutase [Bacteroides sp.]